MNFIISIGGTGTKCMESLTYLMAANFLPASEPYRVFIVDKDAVCGNTARCHNTIGSYHTLQDAGGRKAYAGPGLYECTWCFDDALDELSRIRKGRTIQNTLCQTSRDQQLLNLMFSRAEQTEDLVRGFYGRPSMGAAIFEAVTTTASYRNSELFQSIREALTRGNERINIFLMASIFGGTGASMFPNVAASIRDEFCKTEADREKISISGALLLPYFCFPPQEDKEDISAVNYDDFFDKTVVSLLYYNDNPRLLKSAANPRDYIFDSVYVMGCKPLTETCHVNTSGGRDQLHRFHVVDLFAALSAVRFFGDPKQSGAFPVQLDPNDTEAIGWDHLPGGNAAKSNLVSFARFSLFILGFLKPYLSQDLKVLQKEKLVCKLYGKRLGKSQITVEQLEGLRQAVGNTAAFCHRYLSYLLDIQNQDAYSNNPGCVLFKEAPLRKFLEAVETGASLDTLKSLCNLDSLCDMDTKDNYQKILTLLQDSAPELKFNKNNPAADVPQALLSRIYHYCSV